MLADVVAVRVTGPLRLWVRFDDGAEGEVALEGRVRMDGVFAPLLDPEIFAQVRVDPDIGTITWPSGADLDPIVLHSWVTGSPLPGGPG